ncbi:FUSC family protein [Kocuria sp. NPDC057446]|uniref:FUSC family protein n=1 Tax=Kocuria sp. NPDC057446 TaxID=3346137 RepID=UPI0036BC3780
MSRVREVLRMQASHNDHHVALRTAIGVGVPLLLLVGIGRIDLAIFATFGAFTGIYGRNQPHRQRLIHQATAGTTLLVTILVGAVASRAGIGDWGIVAGATLVAGAAALVIGLSRLKPAGSLFHIFTFGAIASVPTHPPLWQGLLTAALTVAFALAVSVATRLLPSHRSPWTRPTTTPLTKPERRTVLREAARYAIAAGTAGSIATALGIGHNYWAMVAAVVPLVGPTVTHRLGRGVNRVLGTTMGLGLTLMILLLGLEPWAMVLVIAVLQFCTEMFVVRQYAIAQTFVTPMALISTELAHPSPPALVIQDRAIETLIGCAVGFLVVLAAHFLSALRATRAAEV